MGAVADGSRHGEFLGAPRGLDAVDVQNLSAGQALMTSAPSSLSSCLPARQGVAKRHLSLPIGVQLLGPAASEGMNLAGRRAGGRLRLGDQAGGCVVERRDGPAAGRCHWSAIVAVTSTSTS